MSILSKVKPWHIAAAAGTVAGIAVFWPDPPLKIIDMRGRAHLKAQAAQYYRKRRAGTVVDSVVLHQMGGDRNNSTDPEDFLGVTAHYIVLRDGRVYQLWDWDDRLPSSDKLNEHSLAIEFAGNFPSDSLSTDPRDYADPSAGMDQLSVAQARSGRKLLRYLNQNGIENVYAHIQAARKNCPGPDVWGAVGEWGVRQLGMSDGGPGFHVEGGIAIPQDYRDAYDTWMELAA